MNIQNVIDYIWEIAPNPPFGDENIYEFGDGAGEVTGIGVAWWITSDMLQDFARKGYQLGLSHERVIYDIPDTYMWGKVIRTDELETNRRIAALTQRHGISIHRFHSNLDLVEWGMPHAFFEQLGWSQYPTDWSRGVPVVEIEPVPLETLIATVKSKLGLPFVRYDGDLKRVIRRVAVPWGGLCQWWTGPACAAPLGFDAIIGGDIIDGVVRLAREQNWAVIDAMHHATELAAMRGLAERVHQRFPELKVEYYENSMPWAVL
jgi:putative NIF3 family GTP cyclohydrolase 1 type 2